LDIIFIAIARVVRKLQQKMQKILGLIAWTGITPAIATLVVSVQAQPRPLFLAYPPDNHQTTAEAIFLIGSAPPTGQVLVNGKPIQRSEAGYFAPSFPLKVGENKFTLRYQNQEISRIITKLSTAPEFPTGLGFAKNSLTPEQNMARLPNELICFGAIAPQNATITVQLGSQEIALLPSSEGGDLPPNSAVLISQNDPQVDKIDSWQKVKGCTKIAELGLVGKPIFQLNLDGKIVSQEGTAQIKILAPEHLEVVEVIADAGVARTGPSTNYSRLTPLPQGTRASVTGKEGEWLRLDYGGWIKAAETKILPDAAPPLSLIRSVNARQANQATEIIFPLQHPVPIAIRQGDRTFTLTLYNTIAQTDTIRLDDNPVIKRLDWHQVAPTQIEYTFNLKSEQQWGYDVRYEGTSLILSLRHPPQLEARLARPLAGITILLDPGHGGEELGSVGPNGYPEKDVNLVVSKLLAGELTKRGAKVYLTRESDRDVSLVERVKLIEEIKPHLAFSIHYNALPDGGDALNTKGVSTFWYHPQAHALAVFLHNYLVKNFARPSYGVFWNNLALTRPHAAPSLLLELGFMINPEEFAWIINSREQEQLAVAIADGISLWLREQ
jgi:N-acetylmuramoyl-L-alanine amidase